jgi:excisionase family DNA binding protein
VKFLKVSEFAEMMGVSRDWIYQEIHAGRMPIAVFKGTPIKPWLIDLEKAQNLFSSEANRSNVIPISRSLTIEQTRQAVSHRKRITKGNLWQD